MALESEIRQTGAIGFASGAGMPPFPHGGTITEAGQELILGVLLALPAEVSAIDWFSTGTYIVGRPEVKGY